MLNWLSLLAKKSSLLLYLEGVSRPVVIHPDANAVWYQLLAKLR